MPRFLSTEAFKDIAGETKIEVLRNPKTNKLFAAGSHRNFRVQHDIDAAKPMRFIVMDVNEPDNEGNMYETEELCIANAALINVDESKRAEVLFSV